MRLIKLGDVTHGDQALGGRAERRVLLQGLHERVIDGVKRDDVRALLGKEEHLWIRSADASGETDRAIAAAGKKACCYRGPTEIAASPRDTDDLAIKPAWRWLFLASSAPENTARRVGAYYTGELMRAPGISSRVTGPLEFFVL